MTAWGIKRNTVILNNGIPNIAIPPSKRRNAYAFKKINLDGLDISRLSVRDGAIERIDGFLRAVFIHALQQ